MEKISIVINGVGGAGKDTLISLLQDKYKIKNVSSIAPIKALAKMMGWQGEKTDKARKFLSDLKAITTEYNDYPTNYLLEEQQGFIADNNQIMFVHIREPKEIEKFVNRSKTKTITLLIRPREELIQKHFGNSSDDQVENYRYDYVFNNDRSLEEIRPIWQEFFAKIMEI
ncbi:MAG: hypothetical protein IKA36_06570 [Clostridia bacterium]|nr:hypothetical protein [Clostridia bacterium]